MNLHTKLFIVVAASTLSMFASKPKCAPKGMVRIEYVNVSPGIIENSFNSKPKVMYRAGHLYSRLEEAPDPEAHLHQLFIVSAPNVWMINLADNSGKHMVDPDPEPLFSAYIFEGDGMPSDFPPIFKEIQYGCESSFFVENKASLELYKSDGKNYNKHIITRDKWRLTMLTAASELRPLALILSNNGAVVFAIKYLSYQEFPQIDMKLFEPPKEILLKSIKLGT